MVNTKIPVSGRSLDRATGPAENLNAENSERFVDQATSVKLPKSQAASLKPQAASVKLQAASVKLLDTRSLIKFQAASSRGLDQDETILRMP